LYADLQGKEATASQWKVAANSKTPQKAPQHYGPKAGLTLFMFIIICLKRILFKTSATFLKKTAWEKTVKNASLSQPMATSPMALGSNRKSADYQLEPVVYEEQITAG